MYAPEGIETRKSAKDAENETHQQNRNFWVQVVLTIATIGAFGAAAYYAHVAKLQWHTMTKTYDQIKKQTTAAQNAADAASNAASAATTANKDAQDRFRQDERPYVWLTNDLQPPAYLPNFNNPSSPDGQIYWDWHFWNYGKTPAYNLRWRTYIRLGKDAPWVEPRGGYKGRWVRGAPLPPGKDDFWSVPSEVMTKETAMSLLDSDGGVSIRTVIYYTDSYRDITYETDFCLIKLKSGAVS